MDKPIYNVVDYRDGKKCVYGNNKKIANKNNSFIKGLENGETEDEVETPEVPEPEPEQTPEGVE